MMSEFMRNKKNNVGADTRSAPMVRWETFYKMFPTPFKKLLGILIKA